MDTLSEKGRAVRVIEGLDSGTLGSSDAYNILKDLDPILTYFVLRYMREKYGPSHPQGAAVHQRLLELTSTYDDLKKALRLGEKDTMNEWFNDTHSVREFAQDHEAYINLIVDKLEG